MTLKTSALLALIGMIVLSILLAMGLLRDITGFMSGVVPMQEMLRSVIYVFASVSMVVFFYAFHKAQR
jgi:hypothetical protein